MKIYLQKIKLKINEDLAEWSSLEKCLSAWFTYLVTLEFSVQNDFLMLSVCIGSRMTNRQLIGNIVRSPRAIAAIDCEGCSKRASPAFPWNCLAPVAKDAIFRASRRCWAPVYRSPGRRSVPGEHLQQPSGLLICRAINSRPPGWRRRVIQFEWKPPRRNGSSCSVSWRPFFASSPPANRSRSRWCFHFLVKGISSFLTKWIFNTMARPPRWLGAKTNGQFVEANALFLISPQETVAAAAASPSAERTRSEKGNEKRRPVPGSASSHFPAVARETSACLWARRFHCFRYKNNETLDTSFIFSRYSTVSSAGFVHCFVHTL